MTQLANANLLDDDLANGSSLKNKRLSKVAQRAANPIKREANPIPKKIKPKVVVEEKIDEYDDGEEQSTTKENEYQETERYSAPKSSFYADQQRYFDESNKSNTNSKIDADEKKILGMKPALFYGILAVGVLVGGYFVYKKFFNKGSKPDMKPLGNPSGNLSTPTPNANVVSDAPIDIKT